MKRAAKTQSSPCPCGSSRGYASCCGVWHAGAMATDAEQLMRSRYSAYALNIDDYVLATWHPSTRPPSLHGEDKDVATPKFFRLEVNRHTITGADSAEVDFVAWSKVGGRAQCMHEISRFVREDGRWWYVDGAVSDH